MKIPFKCPSCGSENPLATVVEVKSYDDLIGATCRSCGHKITDEDVKAQARAIALELIKEGLKNSGG
jgi:uncharacterized Zn finger protein